MCSQRTLGGRFVAKSHDLTMFPIDHHSPGLWVNHTIGNQDFSSLVSLSVSPQPVSLRKFWMDYAKHQKSKYQGLYHSSGKKRKKGKASSAESLDSDALITCYERISNSFVAK